MLYCCSVGLSSTTWQSPPHECVRPLSRTEFSTVAPGGTLTARVEISGPVGKEASHVPVTEPGTGKLPPGPPVEHWADASDENATEAANAASKKHDVERIGGLLIGGGWDSRGRLRACLPPYHRPVRM